MSKSNIIKLIVGILFALAVALGLIQSRQNPFSGRKTVYTNIPKLAADNGSLKDYYEKAQQLAQKPPEQTTATFLAVGDIMLSRNVAEAIKKADNLNLPFSKMADVLNSTDFNFANLESPFTDKPVIGGHSMVFGAPTSTALGLANNNFKVLNLANNHAFDQGLYGLNYTYGVLDALNIKHMGTGSDLSQAWQPAVINANGLKICFVGASYSSLNDSGLERNNYVARIDDLDHLKLEIGNWKLLCDFIVATMHAGKEYTRTPSQSQIDFAHTAIDAGADVVIGAHPHWVQTIEKYNGKYIFYSLGNFIFDQEWSQDTKQGLALKITVSKNIGVSATANSLQGPNVAKISNLKQIQLLPVVIENFSTPRLANEAEAKQILEKIGETNNILK